MRLMGCVPCIAFFLFFGTLIYIQFQDKESLLIVQIRSLLKVRTMQQFMIDIERSD